MNIVVYVRQIFGAGYQPRIDKVSKRIDASGAWFQHHPKDEMAVEEALRLKASLPEETTLTVVAIGSERVEHNLRGYLAVGADKAVRLWDEALYGVELDDHFCARLVAGFVAMQPQDWIICGDDPFTTLAVQLSEQMNCPSATAVCAIDSRGSHLGVQRRLEKTTVTVAMSAPGILAIEKGHTPRYPKHTDRLKAMQQQISLFDLAGLGLSPEQPRLLIDAVSSPKPGKKTFPTNDANARFIDLVMGGASGEGGKQVVEGSPENLAALAVKKIDSVLNGS